MELTNRHLNALQITRGALAEPSDGWDSALEGTVKLSPEIYDALDTLIKDGVLDNLVQVGHKQKYWTTFSRSSTDKIRIKLPLADWGVGECVVYRSLAAMIGRGQFLTAAPKAFYLIDEDIIVPPDEGNASVKNYLAAVSLAELLRRQADHIDHVGGTPRCVFLHKVSITIPIAYAEEDIGGSIDGLESMQMLLSSDEHTEQKRSIFKAALYAMLATVKEANRFRNLLQHLDELSQEFRGRYQLFVCEFDFEEVREKLEEKRRDYLTQLNSTFHDIGAKLLSIPVAFYVAVTKMEPLPVQGSPFETIVINSVVTLAVIIVSIYILMLLNSHQHTLTATSQEYESLFDRWRGKLKFAEQKEQIQKTFDALDKRRRQVLWYFHITNISVIVTLLIALALYLLRLFRWENEMWSALQAGKTLLFP